MNDTLKKQDQPAGEREVIASEIEDQVSKLNDQSRIFVPLIALAIITAIPVLSKSPVRFLLLLANPFVLLPVGFCLFHLLAAWRRIIRARTRMRELETASKH